MKGYFFLLGNGNSTTSISNKMFANSLIKYGYNIEIIYDLEEKFNILNNCDADIIFFQKTIQCPAHISKNLSHLKGKVFLCHIDDDFQDMKNTAHINTLKFTDLILVGTEAHKKSLSSYTTQPIETISCLLDDENYKYIPCDSKNNEPLIISWQQSCADAYIRDLLSISNPLIELHKKYNFTLNLYGWHMGIDYKDLSAPVKSALPFANFIPYMPYTEYVKKIIPQISKSDIFLSPYIDIPERIGKSGFSLKRIMLLGIPVVCSATNHYKTLISDGVDGFLASDESQWYNKIENLILDKDLRSKFSSQSHLKMLTYYNERAVINKFISSVSKHYSNFLPY